MLPCVGEAKTARTKKLTKKSAENSLKGSIVTKLTVTDEAVFR